MIVRRATAPTVALATLAVVFTACGSSGGDELTMYSGRIAPILDPAIKIYEKHSGTDVKTRFGDSPALAATLTEEGKNSPADLFFAQDAGSLDAVEQQGLLLRLPADILAKVPKHYQSKEGEWVGTTGRARIIAYGTKVKRSELRRSV